MGDETDDSTEPSPFDRRVEPEDLDAARRRSRGGREDAEQGRLAGAVVAQDREVLSGVDVEVDPIETDLGTETLREGGGGDDAHRPNLSGLPSPFSSGVRIKGHNTKGPAKKRSSVATTSVMTRTPDCAPGPPREPPPLAARPRCPGGSRG